MKAQELLTFLKEIENKNPDLLSQDVIIYDYLDNVVYTICDAFVHDKVMTDDGEIIDIEDPLIKLVIE